MNINKILKALLLFLMVLFSQLQFQSLKAEDKKSRVSVLSKVASQTKS